MATKSSKRRARREAQFREVPDAPAVQQPAVAAPPEPEHPDVRSQIRDMVRRNPQKIPGQSGESTDSFRTTRLSAIRGAMQQLAHEPDGKIAVATHPQVIKLVKGWTAAGTPDDLSVKPDAMERSASGVAHLYPNKNGEWEVNDVGLDDKKPLNAGIYLVPMLRSEQGHQNSDRNQDAMALIAKHTKSLDFGRVRAAAKQAAAQGTPEEDISAAIDKSLPGADEAADLSHDKLLAVASAAGPDKQREYAPLIQERFGDLSQYPQPTQAAITAHLKQAGYLNQGELS